LRILGQPCEFYLLAGELFPELWNFYAANTTANDSFVAGVDGSGCARWGRPPALWGWPVSGWPSALSAISYIAFSYLMLFWGYIS
jgi:hypothetical protein